MYQVTLPNGDCATAPNFDAALLAVETLIEDACRYLRAELVIERDGVFDIAATTAAQQAGFVS
jgi:hypothetical protein